MICVVNNTGGNPGGPYSEGGYNVHEVRGTPTDGAVLHTTFKPEIFCQQWREGGAKLRF